MMTFQRCQGFIPFLGIALVFLCFEDLGSPTQQRSFIEALYLTVCRRTVLDVLDVLAIRAIVKNTAEKEVAFVTSTWYLHLRAGAASCRGLARRSRIKSIAGVTAAVSLLLRQPGAMTAVHVGAAGLPPIRSIDRRFVHYLHLQATVQRNECPV